MCDPGQRVSLPSMRLLSFILPSSRPVADVGLEPGAYITDGSRLFRVVKALDPPRGVTAAVLEDCLTLKLRSFAEADLWEMGVRLVKPPVSAAVRRSEPEPARPATS